MMSSEKPNKQGEETSGKQPGPKPEPKNSGTFRDIWSAARKRAEMAHKTIGPPRSMREAMTRAKEIVDEEWQAQGLPRTLREAREMAKTKKDTHANSKAIDDRWQLKLDMLAREIEAAKVRDAIRKRKGEIVKEVETLQYDIEYLIACAYVHQYLRTSWRTNQARIRISNREWSGCLKPAQKLSNTLGGGICEGSYCFADSFRTVGSRINFTAHWKNYRFWHQVLGLLVSGCDLLHWQHGRQVMQTFAASEHYRNQGAIRYQPLVAIIISSPSSDPEAF